jgi:hypothetical protein
VKQGLGIQHLINVFYISKLQGLGYGLVLVVVSILMRFSSNWFMYRGGASEQVQLLKVCSTTIAVVLAVNGYAIHSDTATARGSGDAQGNCRHLCC